MIDSQPSARLSEHDTLLLYGLSASRCAKCKTLVVRESTVSGKAFNLGKRAHMVARSGRGPRGDASLPATARGSLSNHLLLCGSCHDEVDKDWEAWPVDRLRELRDAHQAWVADRLDESTVDPSQLVYASAIDSAVQLVGLASWPQWTYRMTDPKLSWLEEQLDAAGEFRRRMFVADWPATHPEVEIALLRFSWLLSEAASEFSGRADERQDVGDLHVFRRYKKNYNPEYWRAQREFTAWLARYEGMLFEATKAGNWVREAWRAAGNPAFLVNERLHLITGPHDDLREHITVLEYEPEERERLLKAGRERLDEVPALVLELSTA